LRAHRRFFVCASLALVAVLFVRRAPAEDGVVASVDGREIKKSDVADSVLLFARQAWVDAMRECVNRELAEREAERLSVTVTDAAIDTAVNEELAQEKSALLVQFGGKVAFGDFVRDNFRMTEAEYRARVRQAVRTKLLLARVVRFGSMHEERLTLRTIVVRDKAKALEIQGKLKDGADFIALAKRESVDPSAKDGGKLPPVIHGVLQPEIEKAVFELVPGQVSDVLVVNEKSDTTYHLFRLVERQEATDQPYAAVADQVEKDLQARPLESWEVAQWSRKMEQSHDVKVMGPEAVASPGAAPAGAKKETSKQ
jgi:peptidyl-prolyl cis-trans isomerase C